MIHRKYLTQIFTLLACLGLCCASGNAKTNESDAYPESMIRAAVIFGILRFTEWPENIEESKRVNLCTLGKSSSGETIKRLEQIPSIGNRTVTLSIDVHRERLEQCDAIIVGHQTQVPERLNKSILWICDECSQVNSKRFAIRLILKDKRIQFNIDLDQIHQQQLSLNSSLIELAASCFSSDPAMRMCND